MVDNAVLGDPPVQPDDIELICSARGCRAPAVHQLRWNNPKLHRTDARKTWLACDAHRTSLGDFLGIRGFLREVLPLPVKATHTDPSSADDDPRDTDDDRPGPGDKGVAGDSAVTADGTAASTP